MGVSSPSPGEEAFRTRILAEVEAWQRAKIIDEAAAARILASYGLAPAEPERVWRYDRLTIVLAILGAVLAGIGVILFVAANWEGVPRLVKVGLLAGTLVAVHLAAYWARHRGLNRVSPGLILLGCLVYGAGIFLVGQAYHVPVGEPSILLLWAAGVLPMGYLAVSRPSLVLGILAVLGWYALVLARWEIRSDTHMLLAYLSWTVALLGIGEIQGSFARMRIYAQPFVLTGLIGAFLLILPLTFVGFLEQAGRGGETTSLPFPFQLSLWALAAAAVGTSAASSLLGRDSKAAVLQAAGAVALLVVPGVFLLVRPFDDAVPYAIVFNGLAAAAVAWAILVGLWTQRESFVNVGLALFSALVVARYFDVAFTLFDRSLVFIGAGLLLLGGAYAVEWLRRRLLARVRAVGSSG